MFKSRQVLMICLGLLAGLFLWAQNEASQKLLDQTSPGIINLIVYGKDKQEIGKGSALVLTKDIAATSYHLISQAASCIGFNYKKKEVDVNGVVAVDKNLDLALIKIDGKVQPLTLEMTDELSTGKKIFAVGANESGDIIISDGTVRNFYELGANQKIADSSLAIPDTFSGGAIIGENGRAIGLIVILEKRLRFIVPLGSVTGMPKTGKMTAFKNWQPEDYMGTMEAAWLTGRLYAWQDDSYNAQRNLEKITRAEQNNLAAWTILASVYHKQRDYQNSITAYKKVVELDPKKAEAYFGLGQIYVRTQKSAEAIAALEKTIELNPDNKEAFFFLGNAYDDAREFSKAGDAYEKYLAAKPENVANAYRNLGLARFNASQFDAAAAAFIEALKSQPQDQNINYSLAQAYEKGGKLDKAEEVYKNLALLSPKDADRWYSLILNMYARANQPAKAIEAAKKIVELKPNDEQSLYNLGYMYQQNLKYQEAIDAYKQALAVKPTYEYAHFQIGFCNYQMKKYKEAAEGFKKFVELMPDSADGWFYMGICYMQVKDFNSALEPIKKATELKPDYGTAYFNLAVVYLNLHDNCSAREVYKKLVNIDGALATKLKPLLR